MHERGWCASALQTQVMQDNLIYWEHLCQAGAGGWGKHTDVSISLKQKEKQGPGMNDAIAGGDGEANYTKASFPCLERVSAATHLSYEGRMMSHAN